MSEFRFKKSSYSEPNGECVEVARNMPRTVAVRDSTRPGGTVVTLAPAAWGAFTADLRRRQP
ncbi:MULTISPECIES: DUF397 domain-containing protein [Streptomyces]|uniref:DUF397 domain-containing protein n=1 Tax=Streptomyces TaxID=1883 RepID=UPI0015876B01|nr:MULTISPECIES: DUF397 domain-containing protein [Streptomyces]MBH0247125.1 DUF397 domain-containing protein [Streptomyces cavourensis]NUV80470.1 DUF397 domain-containing protein [Streptomyces sp. CAI-155]